MLLSVNISETVIQVAQRSHYSLAVMQVWLWFLKIVLGRGWGVSQWAECLPTMKEAQGPGLKQHGKRVW